VTLAIPSVMRAAQLDAYGGADRIHVREIPTPRPGPGEVLVRIAATSVNRGELALISGRMRLLSGRRFPKGLGSDFSGTVARVGPGAARHAPGDRVWGLIPGGRMIRSTRPSAAAADYAVVRETDAHPLPTGVDPVEAASLPVVGPTALRAVRSIAIRPGERVLVRGATGGVGSLMTQMAAAAGGEVTALVGPRNASFATGLGATRALDYHGLNVDDLPPFDVVLDAVGSELPRYRSRLAPGGRMVTVAADPLLRGLATIAASAIHGTRRIRFSQHDPTAQDFAELSTALGSGRLRPVIGARFALTEAGPAYAAVQDGGGRGKVLIVVDPESRSER
jgi:NADPH:quinone reductase-like Zn-dependent oxidoreductase